MRMSKVPEYPRPHNYEVNFAMPIESAVNTNRTTMLPIITYDEGLGAMSAYKSNPTNASFAEVVTHHCFPTSHISKVFAQLRISLSKEALETDKIHAVRFAVMRIHSSFNETGLASDEVSTLDLNEVLELQVETTDRQMFPLYNAKDLNDYKTNAGLDMPAESQGLDTDLELEGVSFDENVYYDCLHYHTTGNKLKAISDGLRWYTLTKNKPTMELRFGQASNTKYMNPYAFLGILLHFPNSALNSQIGKATDTTIEANTIECVFKTRYNEWNHEFNHSMI